MFAKFQVPIPVCNCNFCTDPYPDSGGTKAEFVHIIIFSRRNVHISWDKKIWVKYTDNLTWILALLLLKKIELEKYVNVISFCQSDVCLGLRHLNIEVHSRKPKEFSLHQVHLLRSMGMNIMDYVSEREEFIF